MTALSSPDRVLGNGQAINGYTFGLILVRPVPSQSPRALGQSMAREGRIKGGSATMRNRATSA